MLSMYSDRYDALYEGINYKSKFALAYNLVFCQRRMIIVVIQATLFYYSYA